MMKPQFDFASLVNQGVGGMSKEEWLDWRRGGIGASEIPTVVSSILMQKGHKGIGGYGSPHRIVLSKLGLDKPEPPSADEIEGLIMEPVIAGMFASLSGLTLERGVPVALPDNLIIRCTPDYMTTMPDGRRMCVEIKHVGPRSPYRHLWGESGSDAAPDFVLLQNQIQIGCTGADGGFIVVKMKGLPLDEGFRVYEWPDGIPFDKPTFDNAVTLALEWWDRYIVNKEPLPVDSSEMASAYVKGIYPRATLDMFVADPDVAAIVDELIAVRQQHKEIESRKTTLENQVKVAIGKHEGIWGNTGGFTWKNDPDKPYLDKDALIAFLNPSRDIVEQFTKMTAGSRRLLFKEIK